MCENGDFRAMERSILNVYEHENAESCHFQPQIATFGAGLEPLIKKGNSVYKLYETKA